MSQNVSDLLGASMQKVRELVDSNTVVGSPIVLNESTTMIPVCKVSFGVASGGADLAAKAAAASGSFGGGAGCGVKITPIAMVLLQGERVRMIPVEVPPATPADRVIDLIPELVEKLTALKKEDFTEA